MLYIVFCRECISYEKKKEKSNGESQALAKKVKVDCDNEFKYESCQRIIYGGSSCISKHLQGSKHKRLMHMFYLSDYFF